MWVPQGRRRNDDSVNQVRVHSQCPESQSPSFSPRSRLITDWWLKVTLMLHRTKMAHLSIGRKKLIDRDDHDESTHRRKVRSWSTRRPQPNFRTRIKDSIDSDHHITISYQRGRSILRRDNDDQQYRNVGVGWTRWVDDGSRVDVMMNPKSVGLSIVIIFWFLWPFTERIAPFCTSTLTWIY